jgi:hypothetical protein
MSAKYVIIVSVAAISLAVMLAAAGGFAADQGDAAQAQRYYKKAVAAGLFSAGNVVKEDKDGANANRMRN